MIWSVLCVGIPGDWASKVHGTRTINSIGTVYSVSHTYSCIFPQSRLHLRLLCYVHTDSAVFFKGGKVTTDRLRCRGYIRIAHSGSRYQSMKLNDFDWRWETDQSTKLLWLRIGLSISLYECYSWVIYDRVRGSWCMLEPRIWSQRSLCLDWEDKPCYAVGRNKDPCAPEY